MSIIEQIVAAEKELTMREIAALRLRGIPASQNKCSIEHLYDTLVDLHIRKMEAQ